MSENSETAEAPGRERRFDVLRNSADLYGAVYRIVSVLAAHRLSGGQLGHIDTELLGMLATKVLPHLPAPSKDANVW